MYSFFFFSFTVIILSTQSSDLIAFHAKFHRQSWKLNKSQKICELAFARLQGKGELIAQFLKRNNRVTIPTEYQPLCYHVAGPQKGTIEKGLLVGKKGVCVTRPDLNSEPTIRTQVSTQPIGKLVPLDLKNNLCWNQLQSRF